MNIVALCKAIEGRFLWQGDESKQIESGYVSDLLSLVMANGKKSMAWVTVQNHMNVIAVAALLEMACVILVEGIDLEENILSKAREENIPVITTPLSAYEVCVIMGNASIAAAR